MPIQNSRLKQTAGVATIAVTLIGGYEGLRLNSYQDIVGVWTVCYGETKDVHRGIIFTKVECDQQFANRLIDFEQEMRKCLTHPDDVPIKPYIAFLSLSYNIGSKAFCRSSVAAAANRGDYVAACQNLLKFDRAGGRVVDGLRQRRESEDEFCKSGVSQ